MMKGKGKNGQPIHGTAALLNNIRKNGGWNKVVTEIAIDAGKAAAAAAGTAAAIAAVEKYNDVSKMPEQVPAQPDSGKNKPTRH